MASTDLFSRIALILLYMYLCCLSSVQGQMEDCDAFTIQPEDMVASAGGMAMMKCNYTDVPVEWDKEGTSIISMQEPCDCHVTDDGTLHFNNVSKQDEAKYTCIAQMGFIAARCSAYLWIAGPLGFLNDSKVGPGVTSAATRELSIKVTGRPITSVVWLHNNVPIDEASNSRLSTSIEEDGRYMKATLMITEVEPEDRGTYTLQVNNSYGLVEEVWRVPVIFQQLNSIRKDHQGTGTKLICTGAYYVEDEASIQANWEVVPREEGTTYSIIASPKTKNELQQQTEFETILEVSTCGDQPELAQCVLTHDGQTTPVSITFCDECTPAEATASGLNCTALTVQLKGKARNYLIEYRPEGTTHWSEKSVVLSSSMESFIISGLMDGTKYEFRAKCNSTGSVSSSSSATTILFAPPVTGLNARVVYGSQIFIRLTWTAYTAANLSRYHIVWRSSDELGEEHADVQFPNTQYDVKIECDVMYTFQVATVNLCGMGPLSNSVQEMCTNVPPPQRVVLHGLVSGSGTSADTLVVSFTVNYANKVTSARIDVLEQDEHFVTVRTLNYTLPPETYNVSRLCIGGLDSKAQYLVCLRVEYSGSGEDSTCSRNVTSEKASLNDLKCQPPTSVMKVVNSQDGNPASTPVPEWGIAVIVVGALLLVALLFCFCGLCFACQTSQNKNIHFGSVSSLNTERGGNVVPTNVHMHNPRTVSPTRSCLKYHRGHSTTWNDHVDTLRQMETDKGTHV